MISVVQAPLGDQLSRNSSTSPALGATGASAAGAPPAAQVDDHRDAMGIAPDETRQRSKAHLLRVGPQMDGLVVQARDHAPRAGLDPRRQRDAAHRAAGQDQRDVVGRIAQALRDER